MFVDNQATVSTSNLLDQISNRNRHIETRFFKICDHVESKEISVHWIPGTTNPSDINTKPLGASDIEPHIDFLLSGTAYSPPVLGGCARLDSPYAKRQTRPRSELGALASIRSDIAIIDYRSYCGN